MSKAKKRAEEGELALFSGAEALREVAKVDGVWNWALVGPEPAQMPLSGGGTKSIEQMRGAFGKHAHCFGLLRMTFGIGSDAVTKFLFIHASDEVDSGKFSPLERGRALSMEPRMEEAIRKFSAFAAKIRIQTQAECTVESFVAKLRSVVSGMDVDRLTVDNFYAAVEHHKALHPEEVEKQKLELKKQEHLEMVVSPRAAAAQPEHVDSPPDMQQTASRQRRKMKLWSRGDVVEVFSEENQKWFLDAEVAEVVDESSMQGNFRVVAGSMKVVYSNGAHFKWVAPQEMETLIRGSPRPRPPDPAVGELRIETHKLFFTQWTTHYLELSKGFLQWWRTREDAQSKNEPIGSVYLLGLQLQRTGMVCRIRADVTKGAVSIFKAESEDEAASWEEDLWAHAGFCDETHEFSEAQGAGAGERRAAPDAAVAQAGPPPSLPQMGGAAGEPAPAPPDRLAVTALEGISEGPDSEGREESSAAPEKEQPSTAQADGIASKVVPAQLDDPAELALVRQGAFQGGGA